MVDQTNNPSQNATIQNPAPAPATSPAQQPSPSNPNITRDAAEKDALARNPQTLKAAHEPVTTGATKQVRSSTLITNPTDPNQPDVPAKDELPDALPQATIDEMAAGKKALERNRPVAQALEEARGVTRENPTGDGRVTNNLNPVDAVERQQQNAKI